MCSALVEVTAPVEFLSCTQIFHYEQRPLSGPVEKQILLPWSQCTAQGVLQASPACVHPLFPGELIPGQAFSNHQSREALFQRLVWSLLSLSAVASPLTELWFVLSCHRSSKWQMRLLQRWTSCWQQRPRSCLDKHHPNCQKHQKHHLSCPWSRNGLPQPQHPPLPRASSLRGGQGQLCALAAAMACLGVCWREGGALLVSFIQEGTELDELRSKIKYQEGEVETAGGTEEGLPCSLCAPSLPHAFSHPREEPACPAANLSTYFCLK